MIERGLDLLIKHATRILAISVLAGLALPDLAALLRPLLTPSVWFMLFFAMLRIDWIEVIGYCRRPMILVGVTIWLLALSPLITWLVVDAIGLTPGLAAGVVLMAASAPIMSSAAFALLIGLDASLSLVTMVIATLAVPFTIPVVAIGILQLDLNVDVFEFMARLVGMIISSLVAALVVRRIVDLSIIKARNREIDAMVLLSLVLFAISIMDGVTAAIFRDPLHMALMVGVAFSANIVLQLVVAGGSLWLGRRISLTLGFASGNRNLGVLLAALPATTLPDTLLFFAVAQIPLFMLPAMLAPAYRKMLGASARFRG